MNAYDSCDNCATDLGHLGIRANGHAYLCTPCANAKFGGTRVYPQAQWHAIALSTINALRSAPAAMKTTCDACGDKLGKAIAVGECKPNSRYLCVECACASRPDELRETAEDIHRRQGHIRVSLSIGPVVSHKLVAAKAARDAKASEARVEENIRRVVRGETQEASRRGLTEAEKTALFAAVFPKPAITIDTAKGADLDTLLGACGLHREVGESDHDYRLAYHYPLSRQKAPPVTTASLTAALLELDAQPEILAACEMRPEAYERCKSKILGRLAPAQHRAAENRASAILSVVRGAK